MFKLYKQYYVNVDIAYYTLYYSPPLSTVYPDKTIISVASENLKTEFILNLFYKALNDCEFRDLAMEFLETENFHDYITVNYENATATNIGWDKLPGMDYLVKGPDVNCEWCQGLYCPTILSSVIMHLNDRHMWSRVEVADWLDTIHDSTGENGPNLNFQTKELENV